MSIQQVLQYFPPGYVRDDIAAAHAAGDLGRLWDYLTLYRGQKKPAVCADISNALLSAIQALSRERGNACIWNRTSVASGRDLERLWWDVWELSRQLGAEAGIIRTAFENIRIRAKEQGDVFFQNRALNEIEILEGKTVLSSQPRQLQVALTTRCNMRCAFCSQGQNKKLWDLPDQVCDEVIGCLPFLQHVSWMGGEAFLHPRFREMVSAAVRHPHLKQTVITNGMFLDESWTALFAQSFRTDFALPMESLDPVTYGRIRRGGDLARLQKNIAGIAAAKKAGADLRMTLNLIVMKSNYREVESIIDYAIEHGFSHLELTPLYYQREAPEYYAQEYASPDDPEIRRSMMRTLERARSKTQGMELTIHDRFLGTDRVGGAPPCATAGPDEGTEKQADRSADAPVEAAPQLSLAHQCRAPWQQMATDENGCVRPFCSCPETRIDTAERSLRDIWNGPEMQQYREKILRGDLSGCSAQCIEGLMDRSLLVMD